VVDDSKERFLVKNWYPG